MKNYKIIMLIVACAVLDWVMVSSSREQERRMSYREIEKNRVLARHILAQQQVLKHEKNQKTRLS